MKKIYSTVMMLAMMVVALSFTACSSDDDDDNGGGNAKKTLTIDGQSYYRGNLSYVVQQNGGMDLEIAAVENLVQQTNGKELRLCIPPSKVSELSVGQVFGYDEIYVEHFRNIGAMPSTGSSWWDAINGEVIIKDIKATELTIQINNLIVKSQRTDAEHKIEGTATLVNHLMDSNGNIKPFSETEP